MQRILGLPDPAIVAYEERIEAAMRAALQSVADKIADRIASIQVASARIPAMAMAITAADTPPTDSVPPSDGLPPGQPYVSPDELASVTPLWQSAVEQQLLPIVAQIFMDAAGQTHANMVDATTIRTLPSVGSLAAEQYLAQAQATFDMIGNDLWETARGELLDGFERGESIPQLADRIRGSASISARTSVLVARTQVIEASNAGSYQTAVVSGIEMRKVWIATPDLRTRPTHLAADAATNEHPVPLTDNFIVGGYAAMFPAAPTLPPAERYNCRCTIGYVMSDDAVAKAREAATPEAPLPGTSGAEAEAFAPKAAAPGEIPPIPEGLAGQQGASSIRPALRQSTPADLSRAWQAEMKRVTGRDIIVQIPPGASMTTMGQYAEATVSMLERFPEMRLRKISWYDLDGPQYARVRRGTATLEFNARWASEENRRAYLASLRSDVKGWAEPAGRGWSVRGASTPQATAYHELGHMLSIETFGGRLDSKALSIVRRRALLDGIADDELVARDISAYAGSNAEEMIAEAFTDVVLNGPAASQVSRELYEMITDEYRRAGLALRTAPLAEGEFEGFTRAGFGEVFPKAAAPKPARVATATGKDLTSDHELAVRAERERLREDAETTYDSAGFQQKVEGYQGDYAFHALAEEQGFNGLPRIVADDAQWQRLLDADYVPLYRGNGWAGGDGVAQVDAFNYGRRYVGGGFAPGNNMSPRYATALDYAEGHDSAVGHYALRPDARVVSYPDLVAERDAFLAKLPPDAIERALYADVEGLGRFGVAKGYDAMVVPRGEAIGTQRVEEWVIFNRTKLVAYDDSAKGVAAARAAGKLAPARMTAAERARREKDAIVTGARSVGHLTRELDQMIAEAGQDAFDSGALWRRIRSKAIELDTPPEVVQELLALARPGEKGAGLDALRAAMDRANADAGITRIGRPGEIWHFDARRDQPWGIEVSDTIPNGTPVYVLRPGSVIQYKGKPLQIAQPRVRPATAEEIRAFEAPVAPTATIVPAVTAPASRLASMKVGDLRALAKERGIAIPAGAPARPIPMSLEVESSLTAEEQARVRELVRRDPQIYATVQDRYGSISTSGNLDQADATWLQSAYERDRAFVERVAQDFQIKRQMEHEAKKLGITLAEYRQRESQRLKDLIADKPIVIRVRDDAALRDILSSGRFKTSLEGARRAAGLPASVSHRELGEAIAGVPVDTVAAERPVYGYVAIHGVEPALSPGRKIAGIAQREGQEDVLSSYGRIQVALRPQVRVRTTVTVGDSLDEISFIRPSLIDRPTAESVGSASTLEDAITQPEWTRRGYIEAQIRGGVRRDDIAEVIFDEEPSAATVAALRENNISWQVLRKGDAPIFPATPAAPPAITAPTSRLASMKVGDLRALAKERGIAIPVGARKADLVKALEERPSMPSGSRVAATDDLRLIAQSPLVGPPTRQGGDTAYVFLETHEGGKRLITKDYTRIEIEEPTRLKEASQLALHRTDAEDLGALVGDAVGLRSPAVIRTSAKSLDEEFIDGLQGGGPFRPGMPDFEETDDGRLLGLLDVITGNPDRRSSNWILTADHRIVSIDMGEAFSTETFAGINEGNFGLHFASDGRWKRNDMSPADMAVIRGRLDSLRPEFERLGRQDWYAQMMDRFSQVEERAKGTLRRLPDLAPAISERAAIRAAARERNRLIESSTSTGRLLAKVDELVAGKATKAVIRQELDPALLEAEQLYAGADRAVVDSLRAALDTGDPAKLRAALTRAGTKSQIKPIGKAGGKAVFDPETMEGVGGIAIEPGTPVIVVRRGSTLTLPDKTTMQIGRAQVTPVQPKVVAAPKPKSIKAATPSGLTSMKVGDLRALAKERGIIIPVGARKADLIKALSGSGPEAVAVARQAGIDAARAVGDLGSEVLELVDSGASARALRARIETTAKRLQTPDAVRDALLAQVDNADALRAAVTEQLGQAGVDTIGTAGKIVRFDRKTMDPIGGVREGDWVVIDRPGTTLNREGEAIQLAKAKVSKASATEAAQARAETEAAVRDTYPARLAQTRKAVDSKATAKPRHLGGGQTGTVTLTERADGTIVEKVYGQRYQMKPAEIKATVDAEVLGAPIVDAVGVRSAATTRLASDRIASEYLEGQTGAELFPTHGYSAVIDPAFQAIIDSDEGRLMGIADYLMYNIDRNSGNWVKMAGDRLGSFDVGASFQLPEFRSPIKVPAGDFTEWLQDPTTRELTATVDIDPRDLAIIRARLEALRPQFTEASRSTWFNTMMRRLGELEKRAVGTRQRITS